MNHPRSGAHRDVSLANYRDRGGNDTAPRWHRAAVCNVADEHDANHAPDPALRLASDYMQLECIHQLAAESSSASQRRPHKLHFAQLPYCLKMLRSLAEDSFSVMSYNVAGLPEILSSGNPSESSVEIGKRISNWDVVNVQEDFNYHAYIYSENSHLYRTATSGGVPFGDGLNTLSNYSFSNITDLTRTKWEDCSTFDGADCLTPKGFTFLEIQLADGVTFDLYNLHTDAGVTDADEVARAANLAQLSEYITANSADNAVIVMGDTNTRYTRSDDTIREFVEGLGLTDGWVQYVRNGVFPTKGADAIVCDESNMTNTCEVVDKILFRGNNYITLSLQKWNNENAGFLDNDGNMLSDHPPISSTFSWALNEGIRLSNAVGGPHGDQFTDVASAAGGQTVKSITLRSGSRVDAVSLTISSPTSTTFSHGGTGGTAKTLALSSGEYITSIEVHWGKYNSHTRIFYLKFATSLGNTLSGGTTTSESATVYAPDGYQLSAFHGRDGDAIDALGAIWTKISS